jgi:ferredoxin
VGVVRPVRRVLSRSARTALAGSRSAFGLGASAHARDRLPRWRSDACRGLFSSAAGPSGSGRAKGQSGNHAHDSGAGGADGSTTGADHDDKGRKTVTVTFRGQTIAAPAGSRVRAALLAASTAAGDGAAPDVSPYNGRARTFNCRGLGTCGTCAVAVVRGRVSPAAPSAREALRLRMPPHTVANTAEKGLRLACQIALDGDVELLKYDGMWGHGDREQPF